ncbi:MAG: DUF362 domain-containing protein [Armatimonadetes bacterium]|nr:DUF362 domain-containing protein [Armatimonadota bacterium]
MRRRDFLRLIGAGLGAGAAASFLGCGKKEAAGIPQPVASAPRPAHRAQATVGKVGKNRHNPHPVPDVDAVVAKTADPKAAIDRADELLAAALEPYGGIEAFVQRGDTVVIKPNLAWARSPEQAADTHPAVLAAVIKACKQAGASELLVVEHTCDSAAVTFDLSGAQETCRELGVPLISLDQESMYQQVQISQGTNIRDEQIAQDILDADVYIDLPVCKVHSASKVTLALKNQLGAVWRPQRYHEAKGEEEQSENLHQNIADLATALRPTLAIIDATRSLVTNGPKGPGNVKATGTIVVSPDFVAADAVACELLGVEPAAVGHIRIAGRAGVGRSENLKVKRVQVA